MWICFIEKVPAVVQASRPLWIFSTPLARGAVGRTQLATKLAHLRRLKQRAGSGGAASACRVFLLQEKVEQQGWACCSRGGEKIGDVAVAVGYENSPHFSRAFKKFYGVSPKQYQSSGQDSN